jgi:hypothetical protein
MVRQAVGIALLAGIIAGTGFAVAYWMSNPTKAACTAQDCPAPLACPQPNGNCPSGYVVDPFNTECCQLVVIG